MMQASAHAPAYRATDPDRNREILFGLHWSPLIGSRPQVLARRRALAMRATHYTHCGNCGVALGVTRLPRRRRGVESYSAAALFAACHAQGEVAMVMSLSPTLHWLVACRDGAVLARTDRVYPTREQAEAALEQLTTHHAGWRIVAEARPAMLAASAPEADAWPALQPLLQGMTGTPHMREMPWYLHARAWPLGAVGSACVFATWACWHLMTPGESGSGMSHGSVQESASFDGQLDPAADAPWNEARLQAAVQDQWTGANAFSPVVQRLRVLPLMIAGWRLAQARCNWQGVQWTCRADYERDNPGATNAALARAAPEDLTLSFTPLSLAHFDWRVHAQPAARPILEMPVASWVDREWVTHLQAAAPAFSYITLGPRDALGGSPFQLDGAEGDSPPLPQLHITRRSLDVQGALRSFSLLQAIERYVAWESVELRVMPTAAISLAGSTLTLALKGWLYEQTSSR